MKGMKYIYLVIFPMIVFAQQLDKKTTTVDFSGEFDWGVDDKQGCVLAISGDSINFEERWMHFVPTGAQLTSKENTPTTLNNLRAPFWAEVSYGAKSPTIYMKSLRFLSQFEYDANGWIIGEYEK